MKYESKEYKTGTSTRTDKEIYNEIYQMVNKMESYGVVSYQ